MTAADLLAQATVLGLILLAVQHRDLISDCMDMNVERLEREEAEAAEACWWLSQMEGWK
jgi:hypothetical protein